MQKPISRRKFLTQAAAGGAALLAANAEAVPMIDAPKASSKAPRPYRPTRAEAAQNEQHLADYDDLIRQPVHQMEITPHWFGDDTRFWYRNDLAHGRQEFVRVEAAQGVRQAAFDHQRLAAALSQAAGHPCAGDRLPFDAIAYTDDDKAVRFAVGDDAWQCDLASYACTKILRSELPPEQEEHGRRRRRQEQDNADTDGGQDSQDGDAPSPDGQWTAFVRDSNLYVRAKADGKETALTHDGTADRPYGAVNWAPDSQRLVAYHITHVPIKPVYMVESSPKDGGTRGVLHQHEYAQAGDPFSSYEMWLFEPAQAAATKAQVETIDFGDSPSLRWVKDGSRFTFERTDRGYQRFRVIAVDAYTGKGTTLFDDQAKTFIDSTNTYVYYTKDDGEILCASERDGWRHLYRFDAKTGALKNQVTHGHWVVRGVDRVDEDAKQVWFSAGGKNPGEDPYHLHHYRVDFDGSNPVTLTDGDGSHSVQYSPDHRWLIDTYSRADLPPVHTLRRTADGAHVCALEKADVSALTGGGWRMPEVFRAKGRDGVTDIWGVMFHPTHLDPTKKYPVIENIYAGPQDSFVRKTFSVRDGMQALAELGFIVVQCDGMGTRNRSKAFQDVCWRNLKDAGFPDRIAWIKALAAKHPFIDTSRVGIYGTSAGGQSSTGALLFHPEFYKVGVSSCGCHDNRIDKQWWNEQWMGYPVGPWYADNSNITHAANLRGKLLLFVGELDSNVPPESTIRLTDALMKAGKDFDLLIITGSDHTSGGTYGERRRRDYFIRHLLGVEPPDRNAPRPPVKPELLTPRPLGDAVQAQADGGDETSIEFRNLTHHEVQLFWLAGGGARTPYGTVAPGGTRDMHTFAGHWWLVAGADGKPLSLFVGENRPGIAEVRSEPDK